VVLPRERRNWTRRTNRETTFVETAPPRDMFRLPSGCCIEDGRTANQSSCALTSRSRVFLSLVARCISLPRRNSGTNGLLAAAEICLS
jgi:hypothetical protein